MKEWFLYLRVFSWMKPRNSSLCVRFFSMPIQYSCIYAPYLRSTTWICWWQIWLLTLQSLIRVINAYHINRISFSPFLNKIAFYLCLINSTGWSTVGCGVGLFGVLWAWFLVIMFLQLTHCNYLFTKYHIRAGRNNFRIPNCSD